MPTGQGRFWKKGMSPRFLIVSAWAFSWSHHENIYQDFHHFELHPSWEFLLKPPTQLYTPFFIKMEIWTLDSRPVRALWKCTCGDVPGTSKRGDWGTGTTRKRGVLRINKKLGLHERGFLGTYLLITFTFFLSTLSAGGGVLWKNKQEICRPDSSAIYN